MGSRKIFNIPGERHYVTFSTYQRRRFLDSSQTRDIVVTVLQECLQRHQAYCSGFVVMTDHVHAILFGEADFVIGDFLQVWKKTSSYRIKRVFTEQLTHYGQMCPKQCPVWQAKFYDFNLESDHKLFEKLNYMHNNPVVANLAPLSIGWAWSSARFYERNEFVGVTITP